EAVVVISSDKVEGSRDWNSLEFKDTAKSGQKKAMVFYQMDTEEVSDRFVAPCFVNGLEAYNGEINLGVEENMISNGYEVKLCLEHEVKRINKVVKKELIVSLRGEIYFVKFIINPEEDDVEPGVIFGRSFLRMTKAITDFGVETVTIYPDIDPFLEETEEEEKRNNDWDHLLDFNIDDVPLLGEEGLPPFVCKMGKSSCNKKRAMENLNFFYQNIGTFSSAGGHLTQEEAAKEAISIKISRKFALLEEEGFNVYFEGGLRSDEHFNAQDYWLSISREEHLGLSRSHTSTIKNQILRVIHKMITYAWVIARWMKRKEAGTQKEIQICCGQFILKLARKCRVLTEDVVRSLSALIYCRDLDTTTLRDLIDSEGRLIPEDPQPGVPRVGIPRPPRASMQDLYDRMGWMEIRQEAIEQMEYRQSYHRDRYQGVFEHMAEVYSVPLHGAYNPPGYAQPQYD
ncbi:hypothetical protein Tco_1329250, partial [Tanacetum coccineum]